MLALWLCGYGYNTSEGIFSLSADARQLSRSNELKQLFLFHQSFLNYVSRDNDNTNLIHFELYDDNYIFNRKLTHKKNTLQKINVAISDIDVKFFDFASELHGKYDDERDALFLNGKTETSLDWAFQQEAIARQSNNQK